MRKKILIIDDEEMIRISLKEGLMDLGYEVDTAKDGQEGLGKVDGFKPHAIFLDIRLPDINGLQLIKSIKEVDKDVEVVIMTAYGDVKTAVTSIKSGAFDYIHKPFDLEEMNIILIRLFDNLTLQKKIYLLEKEKLSKNHAILGDHQSIQEVLRKVAILSDSDDVTVLIRGETGTGKEVVASAIHENSCRKDAPMLKINCAAIPTQLMESELFGHEKNAFTGAIARKKGLVEIADGGTIFLDEIGELHYDMQTKLLRFLEERKFKRVGGLEDIEVDIRIIAATNKNLEEAIKQKEFREDLYYRLNVVPVELPPLRERGEDILLLANHYLKIYSKKFNKSILDFTEEAKEKLMTYPWKGNVRELINVIERMVILIDDTYIRCHHIPSEIRGEEKRSYDGEGYRQEDGSQLIPEGFSLEGLVKRVEKKYIKAALEISNKNHSKAAELLGISRFALKRKIEKYFHE
ncbi:sigma-54-dependent transcriptional regulator [Natronincola ferrireducens]|uniref:Stage 0 sporulation protein A homolog n=1 Tax=Natronincola ferrireducens TaxID=393762 RepID=A0A1G9E8T5_9FIRM|nr:sigma-54 dependent transcriptional regulator [Natronincola ferrireducens]SDK72445.1 DNA-binding transcriptional response regulator, NtrC family, contains REC, AAA-type ATPase, and a Fis-type DNA-binding domains [Natronincola ferrireducens]